MRIILKTTVPGYYRDVMKRFDRDLFLALAPPVAKIELKKFTGSKTGDTVHLQFLFPIKTEWISDIIDHGEDEQRSYFVDKGVVLPFPLGYWEHHHIIENVDNHHSTIVDDIRFKGLNRFYSILLYPAIYLGFLPRKRIYKKYFSEAL